MIRILIVDDSSVMRKLVTRSLLRSGYAEAEIIQSVDGKQALTEFHREPPDIVLSDWNMPNLSGLELLKAIRAEKCSVPFGFITTESTDSMHEIATCEGANFLLSKPFTVDEMKAVIDPILKPLI